MPLDGWDHVELYVGNAKQSAYYYEHAFGFRRTAYAGPETGVRDRASYVLEQNDIRVVADERPAPRLPDRRLRGHPRRRREGHRAARARRARGVPRGGAARRPRHRRAALGGGRVRPRPAGDDRDLRRRRPHLREPCRVRGRVPPRLRRAGLAERQRRRRRPARDRPRRRERRARPHGPLGRLLRARLRDDRDAPLLRRGHLHRVLGPDVEGDDGRPGEDQVPHQRAGRGEAQEPDRGVPRVQPRPGLAARRDDERRTSSTPSRR